MAKAKNPVYRLPAGTASFPHLLKPDTEAPKNASFKPDNKYKLTVTFDDHEATSELEATIRDLAAEKWGKVDFENFAFPFKHHDEDAAKDFLKNKTVITAKSQFKPTVVDAKKRELTNGVEVRGGDVVRIAFTLYFYEKTEKVRDAKTKKTVDVLMRGASAQLVGVQLIEKRAGGGGFGADVFDEEDGYEGEPASGTASTATATDEGDGDF